MINVGFGVLLLVALLLVLTGIVVAARALLIPTRPARLSLNGPRVLQTQTGQKLLAALHDNGVLLPSACAGAGTCGLCRVQISEGGPDILPIEEARFTRAELRAGLHLACQVTVRGDMALVVDEALLDAESRTLSVASARQLTPLIREIVLKMPDGAPMDIHAGSFLQVTAPPFSLSFADMNVPHRFDAQWQALRPLGLSSAEDVTRAYSVANRPEDTEAGRLVFNIRLALPPPSVRDAPPGVVSSWLFAVKQGDQVEVSGPFGSFRAQDTDREMVFIGGGVGMAPLRAMIFEQLETVGTARRMSFWYGARSGSDLYYADEFDALAARHPNFSWTVAMSEPQPEDDWTGAEGFVHSVAFERYLRDHPAPEACEYYLCGPPLMIRAVLSMLDDLGVDEDSIFNDDFGV